MGRRRRKHDPEAADAGSNTEAAAGSSLDRLATEILPLLGLDGKSDHPFLKYVLLHKPDRLTTEMFLAYFKKVVTDFKVDSIRPDDSIPSSNTADTGDAAATGDTTTTIPTAEPKLLTYLNDLGKDGIIPSFYLNQDFSQVDAAADFFLILGLWMLMREPFVVSGNIYLSSIRYPRPCSPGSESLLDVTLNQLLTSSRIWPSYADISSQADLPFPPAFPNDTKEASQKWCRCKSPTDSTLIEPGDLNLYLLKKLANVDILWTDNVSRHLLITTRGQRRYVNVFALPSALGNCPPGSSLTASCNAGGMPVQLKQEILDSYQHLFAMESPKPESRLARYLHRLDWVPKWCWCNICACERFRARSMRELKLRASQTQDRLPYLPFDTLLETTAEGKVLL